MPKETNSASFSHLMLNTQHATNDRGWAQGSPYRNTRKQFVGNERVAGPECFIGSDQVNLPTASRGAETIVPTQGGHQHTRKPAACPPVGAELGSESMTHSACSRWVTGDGHTGPWGKDGRKTAGWLKVQAWEPNCLGTDAKLSH